MCPGTEGVRLYLSISHTRLNIFINLLTHLYTHGRVFIIDLPWFNLSHLYNSSIHLSIYFLSTSLTLVSIITFIHLFTHSQIPQHILAIIDLPSLNLSHLCNFLCLLPVYFPHSSLNHHCYSSIYIFIHTPTCFSFSLMYSQSF